MPGFGTREGFFLDLDNSGLFLLVGRVTAFEAGGDLCFCFCPPDLALDPQALRELATFCFSFGLVGFAALGLEPLWDADFLGLFLETVWGATVELKALLGDRVVRRSSFSSSGTVSVKRHFKKSLTSPALIAWVDSTHSWNHRVGSVPQGHPVQLLPVIGNPPNSCLSSLFLMIFNN